MEAFGWLRERLEGAKEEGEELLRAARAAVEEGFQASKGANIFGWQVC